MHNPGFQDDYSLVTFSRLRYPWEKYDKFQLSRLPISIMRYCVMFFPYILLLIILYIQLRIYPLSSLELSTSLLVISHILFYLLLLVSYRKLYLILDFYGYQSRRYLEARGFDSAYKTRHYVIVIGIFLFVFLPHFLIVLFSNSRFISEQFKSFTYSLTLSLVTLLIFFPSAFFVIDSWNTYRSLNTHAHSYFTHEGIEVNGKINRRKFRMFYSLNEISSFVLLKIPNTLDFRKERIQDIPPEEFALLYILDTLGNTHICGYYIQGSQSILDVYSFLSKQYPNIKIEALNADESSDIKPFFAIKPSKKTLRYLWETAFVTPFYYLNTVVPKEIDPSKNYSDNFPSRSKKLLSTGSNSLTENLTFKCIRSRYKSNGEIAESYFFPIMPWVAIAVLSVFIFFFSFDRSYFGGELNMLAFALQSLLGFYTYPPRKWYLPGLQSVPSLLVITLALLIVIG